jgi:hypothetical protein
VLVLEYLPANNCYFEHIHSDELESCLSSEKQVSGRSTSPPQTVPQDQSQNCTLAAQCAAWGFCTAVSFCGFGLNNFVTVAARDFYSPVSGITV